MFHLLPANINSPGTHTDRQELYSVSATEATYRSLWGLARELLQCGLSVLVDATFLKQADRRRFCELAKELGVPFGILDFQNPISLLEQRIRDRHALGLDASDADVEVLYKQIKTHEPLTASEQRFVQNLPLE